MRVAILVPRRDDGGWRDKLWAHCRTIWEREFPDWPIYEGYHQAHEGPFNRSQAVNRAAAQGEWNVALIIDSDTISDPQAIRKAVNHALDSGALAVGHRARLMLTKHATQQLLTGRRVPTSRKQNVSRVWQDSVSCAVAVSRATWDLVGGLDERFVGWGFEDTAFYLACETLTGKPGHFEQSECVHLWHESQPEASRAAPTYIRNQALKKEYEQAHWDPPRMRAVLDGVPPAPGPPTVIPRILHRTVPLTTSTEVEAWWDTFRLMHPSWDLRTYREPIDPADWPLTGDLFDHCQNGAQKAGLIRLEALYTHGGIYVDSDVEPIRPLDSLLQLRAFAAWEDEKVVPDAILGAEAGHSAFRIMLTKARTSIESGEDAWASGPGVTTSTLPGRNDVLLLPPGSFYPVHYREKTRLGTRNELPWVFLEHKWHHSWDPKKPVLQPTVQVQHIQELPNGIAICIPWHDNGEDRRRRAYKWCVNWWAQFGFIPVIGLGESRAAMCNHAAKQALAIGVSTLVFADADTWGNFDQVMAATIEAQSNILVHAFETYIRLDSGTTIQGLRIPPERSNTARYVTRGKRTPHHVSGLSAISAELWSRVGGFDERFDRWGFEDQAFHLACEVLGDSPPTRVSGTAIHWAHRAAPTRMVNPTPEAICLMQNYCAAAGRIPDYGRTGKLGRTGVIAIETSEPDPDRMREILAEKGGPLSARSAVS